MEMVTRNQGIAHDKKLPNLNRILGHHSSSHHHRAHCGWHLRRHSCIGGRVSENVARAALGAQTIGITSYAVSDYDTVLTIRNNHVASVDVTAISIDDLVCPWLGTIRLGIGESRTITCQTAFSLDDQSYLPIVIEWTDVRSGAQHRQQGRELVLIGQVSQKYWSVISAHPTFNASNKGCWDTSGDQPWPICTCYDLNLTRTELSANFTLLNSIDFIRCQQVFGDAGWNSGEGWEPIGENWPNHFQGSLDGNNNMMSNLFINRNEDYQGLFGDINTATVGDSMGLKNLGVHGTISGNEYVGGVVGNLYAPIVDVFFIGTVNGNDYTGGVVGSSTGGLFSNIFMYGQVYGSTNVGGLIGATGGRIENSFMHGEVYGSTNVGGLIGYLYATGGGIENSYMKGIIHGENGVGGLLGYIDLAIISNSFADSIIVCTGEYCGGILGDNSGGGGTITSTTWVNHTDSTPHHCIGGSGSPTAGSSPAGCIAIN